MRKNIIYAAMGIVTLVNMMPVQAMAGSGEGSSSTWQNLYSDVIANLPDYMEFSDTMAGAALADLNQDQIPELILNTYVGATGIYSIDAVYSAKGGSLTLWTDSSEYGAWGVQAFTPYYETETGNVVWLDNLEAFSNLRANESLNTSGSYLNVLTGNDGQYSSSQISFLGNEAVSEATMLSVRSIVTNYQAAPDVPHSSMEIDVYPGMTQNQYKNVFASLDMNGFFQTYTAYRQSVSASNNNYILASSASKKLKNKDLAGLSASELRLARNEIYARHGRIFKDASLDNYFRSQAWYAPSIPADRFDDDCLNAIEKRNVKFIVKCEKSMK